MRRQILRGAILACLAGCQGPEDDDDDQTTSQTADPTQTPQDGDGDGYLADGDCNDGDPAIHPDAVETCGDGLDADCDGLTGDGRIQYRDLDGDGWGGPDLVDQCEAMAGYVDQAGDCDDANESAYPGAPEWCDGVDNDCDGIAQDDYQQTYYLDEDRDRYGTTDRPEVDCMPRLDDTSSPYYHWAVLDGDCNDGEVTIHPDADEVCGNGRDEDCSGADQPCQFMVGP